jgi:putative lipoprotein
VRRLILLFALHASSAFAQDTWNGSDKKYHFAYSVVFGFVAGAAFNDEPLWVRYSAGMAPGLLKEITDARAGGSGFSGKDLAVDFLGVIVGERLGGFMMSHRSGTTTIAYQRTF